MNLLKILTCCGFVWQCDDIPVVKGAYNCPVIEIGDRLAARLFFSVSNQESRLHSEQAHGIRRTAQIPCPGFLVNLYMVMLTQTSDTMWLCVWTTKCKWWNLVCITKYFQIFVRNISIIVNMILLFCTNLFTCPFLCFPLSITSCLRAALYRCFFN